MWRSSLRATLGRRFAEPVARGLAKAGLSPNMLTLLGFGLSLVSAFVLALGYFLAGGILVLVSGAFDMLDGALARATGRVTAFGALLDSTMDRLSEAAILFGLLYWYTGKGAVQESLLLFAFFTCSILVSYVRARSEALGIQGDVGFMARPERVVLLALGLMLNLVTPALWILTVLIFLTFLQRMAHAWRQGR